MNEDLKSKIKENAYKDYVSGMTYKEIATKYDIKVNTLKSWASRGKWKRATARKNSVADAVQNKNTDLGNNLEEEIRQDLLNQLEANETKGKYFIDLVEDYMEIWKIKNRLIADVKKRGVQVKYQNGKDQWGHKKNDSIPEIIKYNAQMLNLLDKLGIKANIGEEDDDIELL